MEPTKPSHKRKVKSVRIVARRQRVAELYLTARTQMEIAKALECSVATVCNDLKAIQKQWMDNAMLSFDKVKSRELAAIDRLEREYWDGWIESQKPKETTSTEQTSVGGGDRLRAAVRTEKRDGDPRYLAGVQWCIDKRCQIMGINAMQKQLNVTRDVSAMSDEELEQALKKYGLAT